MKATGQNKKAKPNQIGCQATRTATTKQNVLCGCERSTITKIFQNRLQIVNSTKFQVELWRGAGQRTTERSAVALYV